MLKKVILLLAAVVVLSIAICGCSGNSGVGATGISLSEYNTIELGMSFFEVKEIYGGKGNSDALIRISEKDNSTDDKYERVVVYKVLGEKSGYAEFEFTYSQKTKEFDYSTDKLTAKTQYNLS